MFIIEILKAIILGIVEGITEWLPISSTGHMILLDEFLQLDVSEEFLEMLLVVIQLGAICAVPVLFWDRLWPLTSKKSAEEKKGVIGLWGKVIVGALPAAILGFLFDDLLDKYLYNYIVVAIALIVYGIAFIFVEKIKAEKYYEAYLNYPPLTILNLFNPFSPYRTNILEKEARKAARSKTGRV